LYFMQLKIFRWIRYVYLFWKLQWKD
jgi:hypothetical protein